MFGLAARRLAGTMPMCRQSYGRHLWARASPPAPAIRLGRRQVHQGRALRQQEGVSKATAAPKPKLPTGEKPPSSGPEWDELPLWKRGLIRAVFYGGVLVVFVCVMDVFCTSMSRASLYYMYWTLKRAHPDDFCLQSYDIWVKSLFFRMDEWYMKLHDAGFYLGEDTIKRVEEFKRLGQQMDIHVDEEMLKEAEERTGVRWDAETVKWMEVSRRLREQDSDK